MRLQMGPIKVKNYSEIFNKRGDWYHEAMGRWPDARANEFFSAIRIADIRPGERVCDVPSGGGYLNRFLSVPAAITSVETSSAFLGYIPRKNHKILAKDLDSIPMDSESMDKVISIAGLHHLSNLEGFFQEVRRILKPNGACCIADVREGSRVDSFLNGFVNQFNSLGHEGRFFTNQTNALMNECGLAVEQAGAVSYPWNFSTTEDMVSFCRFLFGLDKGSDAEILQGIGNTVGYAHRNGKVEMNWELQFIRATRSPT